MKLPQAIMHRIMNDAVGENIKRDANGMYVIWDRLEISLSTGVVRFLVGDVEVGTLAINSSLTNADVLQIYGLEGHIRIQAGL